MNIIATIFLTLFSLTSAAVGLKPFKATYEVSRGGKITGRQITELKKIDHKQWRLIDFMEGTHGMASVLGFERRETTDFIIRDGALLAISHQMEQKAAFSKRHYQFKFDGDNNRYTGKHKGETFSLQSSQPVISTHLIPLAIGLAACNQQRQISLKILKSAKARDYHFTINLDAQPISAARQFPADSQRTSQSWLTNNQLCLPEKQLHREQGEPEIVTRLISFDWQE